MLDASQPSHALATFEPQSFAELDRMAIRLADSELVPKDYRGKPANIVAAIIAGREIGLSANRSLHAIAIINGRATLWGDDVLGLVRARPDICEYVKEWSEGSGESEVAYCEAKRRDQVEPVRSSFSVADAKRAHLWMKAGANGGESPWVTYPSRMLKMRARSWCLRDAFPDVLRGMAVAEEVQDYPEARVVSTATETRAETVLALLKGQDDAPADRPLPDVSRMKAAEISDQIAQEAQIVGMPSDVLREFIPVALDGKKLTKETALDAIKAIRTWVPPEPEPEPVAEAEQQSLLGEQG